MAEAFSWDRFFRTHWRRQPLVVRGGAGLILDTVFDRDWLLDRAQAVEHFDPQSVTRGGNGVVFVQNIDRADAALAAIAAELGRRHHFHRPWFDGVLTRAGSSGGIGCHYDDSDNFVLQQRGSKLWRVGSADTIPVAERRQRMMKRPGIGRAQMPEGALEVLLEPGDLLYIPLLWPHWGHTMEDSLSVSLVCNATNAARTMAQSLGAALSAQPDGWQALPRMSSRADAEEIFDRCWTSLTSNGMRARMRASWLRELGPLDVDAAGTE